MKSRNLVIPAVVVLLVIGGLVVFAVLSSQKSDNKPNNGMATMPMNTQPTNKQTTPQATNAVTVENYTFSPAAITVKTGTTVTWTNKDNVGHTVTADSPSGDAPSSDVFTQGKSYSFTFTKAGMYTYHCQLHPYMTGKVIVTE